MEVDKTVVGRRINSIRKEKGLSMEAFGLLVDNASKGLVNNWEKGVNLPNNKRLKIIAELGNLTVSELLYGSIEDYLLQEIKAYFDNNEGVEFSKEGENEIIKDALQQSLKNTLINALYGEENEKHIFNSLLNDEITKAILRRLNLTGYTNSGFIRYVLIELKDTKDQLKGYLDNGIDKNLYDETVNILDKASTDIKALKEKYNNTEQK